MAAIGFGDELAWFSAASVLAFVAEKLSQSGKFPRQQKAFEAIEAGWQYLDLSDLDPVERRDLATIISGVVSDVKMAGAEAFGGPQHFPGFMARLEELQQMTLQIPSKSGDVHSGESGPEAHDVDDLINRGKISEHGLDKFQRSEGLGWRRLGAAWHRAKNARNWRFP